MPRRRLKSRPPLAASLALTSAALVAGALVAPLAPLVPAATGATPSTDVTDTSVTHVGHRLHRLGRLGRKAPDAPRSPQAPRAPKQPRVGSPLDPLSPVLGQAPHRKKKRKPADLTFKVGTLNILGSQHTRGGDHQRTVKTADLIRRNHLGVVLMQEVQADQNKWLAHELPGYRIWPGDSLGPQGIRLQIAFKKKRFEMVDSGTITTTFSHQRIPTPWVKLLDEETGRKLFVIDVHNSPVNQEHDRDTATRKEIRLYQELRDRGPVFIGGDTNEHDEWFCKVTGRTDALAANGGDHDGGCHPPRPVYIDWLMGHGHFTWSHYRAQEVSVSDHMLHTARLTWRSAKR